MSAEDVRRATVGVVRLVSRGIATYFTWTFLMPIFRLGTIPARVCALSSEQCVLSHNQTLGLRQKQLFPTPQRALQAHSTAQTEQRRIDGLLSNSRLPRRQCSVLWQVLHMVRPRRETPRVQIKFADKHVYLAHCLSCRNILASRHSHHQ